MRYLSTYNLIKESVAEAKSFWSKEFPNIDNFMLPILQKVFHKNPGYIGPFMKLLFRNMYLVKDGDKEKVDEVVTNWSKFRKSEEEFLEIPIIEQLINCYFLLVKHKQLFSKINISDYGTIEAFSDYLNNTILNVERRNFVKSFISNKYQHLINDETIALFDKIKNSLKITDHEQIQKFILGKIAAYKTPEEFNTSIKQFISTMEGSSNSKILKDIKEAECNLILDNDQVIICEVPFYESMQLIGSPNWCIRRQEYFWNNYLTNHGTKINMQYIIWDLRLETTDPYFMLGVTINEQGGIRAAHNYNDDEILNSSVIQRYMEYLKPMSTLEFLSFPSNYNKWDGLLKKPDLTNELLDKAIDEYNWDVNFIFNHNYLGATTDKDILIHIVSKLKKVTGKIKIQVIAVLKNRSLFNEANSFFDKFKDIVEDYETYPFDIIVHMYNEDGVYEFIDNVLNNPTYTFKNFQSVITENSISVAKYILDQEKTQDYIKKSTQIKKVNTLCDIMMSNTYGRSMTKDRIELILPYFNIKPSCEDNKLLIYSVKDQQPFVFKMLINLEDVRNSLEESDASHNYSYMWNVICDYIAGERDEENRKLLYDMTISLSEYSNISGFVKYWSTLRKPIYIKELISYCKESEKENVLDSIYKSAEQYKIEL